MDNLEQIGCLVEIGQGSCSGIVLNESYVLTHASIFVPQLLKDPQDMPNIIDNVIGLQISKTKIDKKRQTMSILVKTKQNQNLVSHVANIVHVWKAWNFSKAHQRLFPEHGKWSFSDEDDKEKGDDEQYNNVYMGDKKTKHKASDLLAKVMPYFILLKLETALLKYNKNIYLCNSIKKGLEVRIVSTPFGNICPSVFYNSVSVGVVSQYIDKSVILTDVKVAPGTEGGPLCVLDKNRGLQVVGILVAPLFWKNTEWLGLSIACCFEDIMQSLYSTFHGKGDFSDILPREINHQSLITSEKQSSRQILTDSSISTTAKNKIMRYTWKESQDLALCDQLHSVALIQGPDCWGTGVIIDKHQGYVLTCAHVVKRSNTVRIRLWTLKWYTARIVFRPFSIDPVYDLAILCIEEWQSLMNYSEYAIPQVIPTTPIKGSRATVIGHSPFGPEQLLAPGVCMGVVSQIVCKSSQPILVQTSCTVQAGSSGGPVFDMKGRLVGVVTSNAKDTVTGGSYPHINLVVPAITIWPQIKNFLDTKDHHVLKALAVDDKYIRDVWMLKSTDLTDYSTVEKSKL